MGGGNPGLFVSPNNPKIIIPRIPAFGMKSVCVFVWQELLERAEWGTDLPSVDQHLQDHHTIHTAVEDLLHSLKEARSYEVIHTPRHRVSHLSDPSIDRLICVFFFFFFSQASLPISEAVTLKPWPSWRTSTASCL